MKTLILHPTELSQWHSLVNEAQAATQFVLDENTESYLVFLLMRFTQGSQLMESVLALEFLDALQHSRHKKVETLRDVGDKSLLFCGLFPGMAKKRRVSVDYFIDLGQAAYRTVGDLQQAEMGRLYWRLSSEFYHLQQILQAMRNQCFQKQQQESTIITLRNLPVQ